MITYDPRSISTPVYTSLKNLRSKTLDKNIQKEQKGQAVELYTYLATWGLMRLRAEEMALSQVGKKAVVQCFFETLKQIASVEKIDLDHLVQFDTSEYLGLSSLGLQVAREFAFWATAIYHDVKVNNNE